MEIANMKIVPSMQSALLTRARARKAPAKRGGADQQKK